MNILRHVLGIVIATAITSCCDYEWCSDIETPRDITQCFDAQGKAWLTISFDLSQPSKPTRADNDAFGDGDESECAIKTLTVILFHGPQTADEDSLVVASTYTVGYTPFKHTESQLTNYSGATVHISHDNLVVGDRLSLLAIANMVPDISIGQTFAAVKNQELSKLTYTIDDNDYFVMTNSPLATASNGSGEVQTLIDISPDYLFPSAEESQLHPAGEIYMERAAARLTVTQTISPMVIKGNTDVSFNLSDMRFGLYKYNLKCYLVRHFDSQWLSYNTTGCGYRFTEPSALPTGRYRTYWAHDPNYNGTGSMLNTFDGWKVIGDSYYMAENTFDVSHMTYENTTAAIICIQLNGGNDFYTTSTTGSDIIYQLPESSLEEQGTSAHSTFARQRSPKVSTSSTIDEYLREWLMQTNKNFRQWVNDYAGGEVNHVHIAVEKDASDGLNNARVTAVTQTARTSGQGITDFNLLNLVDYLNTNISLSYYHEGRCFYHIPIRHFDDTLTPWQSPATATDNSAMQAYGNNENDYLGRYGVVRNNWYNININSITHIGSPVIPSQGSDADDKVEQLLNATLSISGWTIHNQNL